MARKLSIASIDGTGLCLSLRSKATLKNADRLASRETYGDRNHLIVQCRSKTEREICGSEKVDNHLIARRSL